MVSQQAREDDSYVCPIKPEEAQWLEAQLAAGALRLAKAEDIKEWEALAIKKERPNKEMFLDCGRTFVVLKELMVPNELESGEQFSTAIVFIVPADVPAPDATSSGIPSYDLKTGGVEPVWPVR